MMPPGLTNDEQWLVDQIAAGIWANGGRRKPHGKVEVRVQVIRQLALDAVRPFGVRARDLRVVGKLDLVYAEIHGPLAFLDCEFDSELRCSKMVCVDLDLSGSKFPALRCEGTSITNDLTLSEISTAAVRIGGVLVGGTLNLTGAKIRAAQDEALVADEAHITGNFFCGDGFRADGEVRLLGATVGGQLGLSGGTFHNPGGDAVSADGAQITGDVFCQIGFRADGQVRLPGSTIGGTLGLTGGVFHNPEGEALNIDGARIVGDVIGETGFRTDGEVRMLGVTIGGALGLTGAVFHNPDGEALNLEGAKITGTMFCNDGFRAEGQVRLLGTTISGQLVLTGGTFNSAGKDALSVNRADIATLSFKQVGAESRGRINLTGAHVGYLSDEPISWQPFDGVELLDFTYDRIALDGWSGKQRLHWLGKGRAHQNQPYEQLAQVLRSQGQDREAREILIAKHQQRRNQEGWLRKISSTIFGAVLGYGYRPLQRTLPALAILYLIGALWLLPLARDRGAVIATRTPVHVATVSTTPGSAARPITATRHCPDDYPCFSPFAYTADVLIPLINTHQTDYWTITSNHTGRWVIVYTRLATVLGWALSTAAAFGFTGLIRRD